SAGRSRAAPGASASSPRRTPSAPSSSPAWPIACSWPAARPRPARNRPLGSSGDERPPTGPAGTGARFQHPRGGRPMPFNLNRVELIGRLGHEPELRFTGENQAVAKFSLATDRRVRPGAQPETDWHQVVCWAKLAESAGQSRATGRLAFVAGRVTYRTWEDKDGQKHRATEIVATELIPLDRRPAVERAEVEPDEPAAGDADDDLPF